MKEKRWMLYKASVYLSLAIAALIAVMFLYNFIPGYKHREISPSTAVIYLLILIGLMVQIIFNVLNVRLLHHYNTAQLLPTTFFTRWHNFFLVLTCCFALFLIIGFIGLCVEVGSQFSYRHRVDEFEAVLLFVFGLYVFFSIYTITGSIRLKRYLKINLQQEEEQWLNQLGNNPSLN